MASLWGISGTAAVANKGAAAPGAGALAAPSMPKQQQQQQQAAGLRGSAAAAASAAEMAATPLDAAAACGNPLLSDWDASEPYGLPPFSKVSPTHFRPAFDVALGEHLAEVASIAACEESPTFDNTALAFDRCGTLLTRISSLFSNLCSSNTSPELQEVELEMAPVLAGHSSKIYTFPGLFPRIDALHAAREEAGLNPEQVRLVERLHLDFVRAGARFDSASQARYSEIMGRLAELTTVFSQNVLGDETAFTLVVKEGDLSGCPPDLVAAARQAGVERGKAEDEYVITLSRSLVEPFLTFSDRRDLREEAWRAWTKRGELNPERDNHPIIKEILLLRAEQARMHGFPSFADYQTADTMAQRPGRVMELLENVWGKATVAANSERESLLEYAAASGNGEAADIEPWDWRYYAEKVRQNRYNFDEAELKPYLSLEAVSAAVFDVAGQLFGLSFEKKPEVEAYHPDVDVYEVRDRGDGGRLVAIFLHDNYGRANKRSGAWMSELREACPAAGSLPIILNNNNFAKGSEGSPTLLSYDDAKTLFHEFGHGCHGMLSTASYFRLAGTNVLRDFVELPSQLMEHWLDQPEVLKKHARHYKTGESVADELLARLQAARNFNQGFATVEYTISALLDQSIHKVPDSELAELDVNAFEQSELARLGMPQGITMRHRPTHFQHLFSTSAYAAAYYVYLWAEVLDADGFEAFMEAGSCFDSATAAKVRKFIYSSGNSLEPGEAYRSFRGRDPTVEPMLKKKGLLTGANA
eukprot:CAMPEP_0117675278 /NCGR_PEP_ID=MMETSP0804-20121206/15517_1 /TAXON_ID=1074897 /ORGANISM="Tetraselmis astigmatica, Strain CCMP880" /LENGTH=757 /DNA_ID=CAMNT_0005484265 /DNA_START=186 /DNA_END=2459 /DNA_ORIENTATION=-